MNRLTDDLAEQRIAVEALEAEIAALVTRTSDLADEAKAAYDSANAAERAAIDNLAKERREFKAAEARRAAAAAAAARAAASGGGGGGGGGGGSGLPPGATPGFLCPVQGGAAFANTWGAPRSGGRRHKGVDMFNARNTPLVAVVDGTVRFSSNSLGGLSTHVYSDDGVTYYYAHLESHPTNISSGQRVSAGTIVGYLGNSGNARYTSPHVHFEIRPGGRAVNPYPTVSHYC
jgi:murein DD-endopeptidase MepM/ murein hydrolase activator NlpD